MPQSYEISTQIFGPTRDSCKWTQNTAFCKKLGKCNTQREKTGQYPSKVAASPNEH